MSIFTTKNTVFLLCLIRAVPLSMSIFLTILAFESWINFICKEPPLLICQPLILTSYLFITLRFLRTTTSLLLLGLLNLVGIILINLAFFSLLFGFRVFQALLFEILVAFEELSLRQEHVRVSSRTQIR